MIRVSNEHLPDTQRGFSLIELAIVLLIIGLITASVLFGRVLIRSAEIRGMHAEHVGLVTAVQAFRAKYGCIPGDCAFATDFFPERSDCPDLEVATPASPAGLANIDVGEATCDGDGDERLDADVTTYEIATIWQQLGNAGLINGRYAGSVDGAWPVILWKPGINAPPVRSLPGSFQWAAVDGDNWSVLVYLPDPTWASLSLTPRSVGTVLSAAGNDQRALTPSEQYAFDSKFDDGSPVNGAIIQPVELSVPNVGCTTAFNENAPAVENLTAQYLLASESAREKRSCTPTFVNVW
jgi:prepilin-type N-terminal cleavage/methylation domain-containing protein